MGLTAQLADKRDAIVEKWFVRVIESYPAETARFLRSKKDRFANPVGQTTLRSLNLLIDLLETELNPVSARNALDPIMRIRAVQDFAPSRATRFLFDLKGVLRDFVPPPGDGPAIDELAVIENRIDELVLIAFDIYMQCREKVYELKANETKQRTYHAFARAGLIREIGDE